MNIFEEFFTDNTENSRHHKAGDINPCYVYLMQTSNNEIMAAYKIPYNQADNGGLRLSDFISSSIAEEKDCLSMPDFMFRSYYVPCGTVLPEIKRDSLETIWTILDQKGYGILEKQIPFKEAAFALTCRQPYFNRDGTAFNPQAYNDKGWKDFLETDSRRYITEQFEGTIKTAMKECQDPNINKYRRQELITEFNNLIAYANQYKGLVPKLYDTLQKLGRNDDKQNKYEILQKWTFPSFFATNFANNKWTDKDMLRFISETGMDIIQYSDNNVIKQFFERQRLATLVSRYNQSVANVQDHLVSGIGNGQFAYEKTRTMIANQIRIYCIQRLNEMERFSRLGYSPPKETTVPAVKTDTNFISWEEQNKVKLKHESILKY